MLFVNHDPKRLFIFSSPSDEASISVVVNFSFSNYIVMFNVLPFRLIIYKLPDHEQYQTRHKVSDNYAEVMDIQAI